MTAICQRDFAQLSLGRTEAEKQDQNSAEEESPQDSIANPLVRDESDVDDDPVAPAQCSPYSHPLGTF